MIKNRTADTDSAFFWNNATDFLNKELDIDNNASEKQQYN